MVEEDKRYEARRRTLRRGQILFDDMKCVADCTVTNLSEQGARLQPADPFLPMPADFLLNLHDGPQHRCRVVWRKQGALGVAFLQEDS